jgi:hypothetical protein
MVTAVPSDAERQLTVLCSKLVGMREALVLDLCDRISGESLALLSSIDGALMAVMRMLAEARRPD